VRSCAVVKRQAERQVAGTFESPERPLLGESPMEYQRDVMYKCESVAAVVGRTSAEGVTRGVQKGLMGLLRFAVEGAFRRKGPALRARTGSSVPERQVASPLRTLEGNYK